VRIAILIIAVVMAWRTMQAMRTQGGAVHSIRLGFWLTMAAWVLTRVAALGYLAAGLLGLSLLGWVFPALLPRSRSRQAAPFDGRSPRKRISSDSSESLDESLATLAEANEIASLPEQEVISFLDRPELPLRLAAAERLRQVATERSADRLTRLLYGETHEPDESVRLKIALVLARWKRTEALPVLAAALHPGRPGRWEALEAVVQMDAHQYVPEVVSLAEGEQETIGTLNAVHGVMRLGGGEQLLRRRSPGLFKRYYAGAKEVLPHGAEDVQKVADLLRGSSEESKRDLAERLEALLHQQGERDGA
jgi:hypothetical protein